MKVLVTNDDGYLAIGIKRLVEKIKDRFEEIIVVAPKTQKSATSHSIILKGGIEFKQVSDIVDGVKTYYCDGNPADCVSVTRAILKYPYDLVISGCNNGINLGFDVIYSGTVAGAGDALINGKKGLAISCKVGDFDSLENLDSVFDFIDENKLFEKTDLINVNLIKNPKGIKLTHLGKSLYGASYTLNEDGLYYPVMGDVNSSPENTLQTDWGAFLENYISVTPLTIDMTDYNALKEYKK